MFVIQTLLVYGILFTCMFLLCRQASIKHKSNYVIAALIIYSIIFGLRYGVGADYFGYLEYYISDYNENIEPGFNFLVNFLNLLGAHYTFYFGIIAFIQLYLIFKAVKNYYDIYACLIFIFITNNYWLTFSNGLRQILAFAILAYSIKFLLNHKYWQYILCGIIAMSIHKSAIIPLVIYPILTLKIFYFKNIALQILGIIIALFLMNIGVISNILGHVDQIVISLGYGNYIDGQYDFTKETNLGVGFYITLILNIIIVLYSNKMKEMFNNTWIPYAYNLFYIGILLKYIFISSQLFSRINYYFSYFGLFIGAFTLLYLYNKKKNVSYIFIVLSLLTLIAGLYRMDTNTSMFFFFWQENQYNLLFGNKL